MEASKRIKGIRGALGTKPGSWSGGVVRNDSGEIRFAMGALFAGVAAIVLLLIVTRSV